VIDEKVPGFQRWLTTAAGRVPQISCALRAADHLGAWKARWGINRMRYLVPPGLYAIGEPSADAPVLVTANYKMSYDLVRRALAGRSVWLLVLETYGINVWCAAGKGTFGTGELVRRIAESRLASVVSHRGLILPMLGAPGVAAHEVKRRSGFTVSYGPIRSQDLPAYLDQDAKVTPEMRRLSFTLYERLVLVPVEIVLVLKSLALTGAVLFAAAFALAGQGAALRVLAAYLGAVFTGIALAPVLLPWLPGRSFALKGAAAGLAFSAAFYGFAGGALWGLPVQIACFLAPPAVSAFYTLNFTGCTTYTSRSGVRKEMRLSLPVMAAALLVSLILVVGAKFV
jgi:acetyl-CoA decarbonylase/synthase complex subunit gamma